MTLVLHALLLSCLAGPADAPPFSVDALWDDGLAEVARYDAERVFYGRSWKHAATLIVVKEDLDAETLVKADPPHAGRRLVPVLKLNWVAQVDTGNYPYQLMGSAFVRRADPARLLKLSASSQEWCGNTFQMLRADERGAVLHHHSYFDGEADGERRVDLRPGDLVEDALPVQLRALPFQDGLERRVRVLPLLTTNRARPAPLEDARLRVAGREAVQTGLGPVESFRVELIRGERVDRYWFEAAAPHVLTAMEAGDGRKLLLRERRRYAYWQR